MESGESLTAASTWSSQGRFAPLFPVDPAERSAQKFVHDVQTDDSPETCLSARHQTGRNGKENAAVLAEPVLSASLAAASECW